MWNRVKQHWLVTMVTVIVGAVIFYGDIASGIQSIVETYKYSTSTPEKPQPPSYNVALENVDFAPAPDGTIRGKNRYRINFAAILSNRGANPVHISIDHVETNIGRFRNEAPSGRFQGLDVGPGIRVNADIDSIGFVLKPGDFLEGRIDWVFRYGEVGKPSTETMRVSGALAVRMRGRDIFPIWVPDDGSARPQGMIPTGVEASTADPRSPAQKAADAEAVPPR